MALKRNRESGKRVIRKRNVIFKLIGIAIVVFILCGLNNKLTIRHYDIESDKFTGELRLALITDLHSCKYGEQQEKLIRAIDEQKPDLILMGGDIFDDDRDDELTNEFLSAVCDKYPCYYVTGNHECWAGAEKFRKQMTTLAKFGITRLSGDTVEIPMGDSKIRLTGVDDPSVIGVWNCDTREEFTDHHAQVRKLKNEMDEGVFTILLSHRPENIRIYAAGGFDLVLSGHAHGGQWRIPGIINGVYAPNQGLFPKYAGGKYEYDHTTMIVSRGLAKESTPIPRFYNPPELVIIDLHGR